jgi:hypothetical protein
MREVRLTWSPENLAETEFAEICQACEYLEVLGHLDIADDGIRQLVKVRFIDGKGIDDLDAIDYITVESPLPPHQYPDVGGEGYIVITNNHPLSTNAILMDDITVLPPYRLGREGMVINVRGLPAGVLTFVKLAREILPPDGIAVTAGEEVEEGLANILTDKQRQALKAAVSAGWFEIPRRVSLKELSELTGISKSTLGEHLEKATSITMKWLVGSQQV